MGPSTTIEGPFVESGTSLEEMQKKVGEAVAEAKDNQITELIDGVKDDKEVDPVKLAELDRAMTEAQKQLIMRQFLKEMLRQKRRRSQATKKKVTPGARKKKRQSAKAARKKNR